MRVQRATKTLPDGRRQDLLDSHDAAQQQAWRCVNGVKLSAATSLPPNRFADVGLGAHRRVRPPHAQLAAAARAARSAIPAKISTPPAISSACSDSESRISAKSTAKNGCRFAKSDARDGADAVDRREPEDVRQEERPDHGVAEAEPDLPAEGELLLAELRDADERERHPADREHERADPVRRVAAHERRDRDRVARPGQSGGDRDQRSLRLDPTPPFATRSARRRRR